MNDHLQRLSHRLVSEGPGPVHADLVRLASESRVLAPGAAAALADAGAPDVVRLRAFSVIARHLHSAPVPDRAA